MSCLPPERAALLAFKQGITSDPAGILDSGQQAEDQDFCRWRGVQCSNRTGRVLKLELGNQNSAAYGYWDTALVGQISRSLLALRSLKHLDLRWNCVEGPDGHIPGFLGSLKNLRHLDLSGIQFTGSVPPQLGNLSKLQHLDLSSMPDLVPRDVSWLTRLPFLRFVSLRMANLGEVADDFPLLLNMAPFLRVLDLSDCPLVSANQSVPHQNLTNLQELYLSWNYFDHPIASAWFWNITSLKVLDLGSTCMYGRFPKALGAMESLQVLDVSGKGVIMSHLENLCSLKILNLGYSLLYGTAADVFEKLPRCSRSKLLELYLSNNNIDGSLPVWMGHLTSLAVLDLSQNNLTGPLPVYIGHFTSLTTLDLSGNQLTGHVPDEVGMLTNLTNFHLSSNRFHGTIKEQHLDSLKNLKYIDLSYNSLKIEISSQWKPAFTLWYADFSNCTMGPQFPAWLRWMVDINELCISSTGISDRIPHWFSSAFSKARMLKMANNKLNGSLPADMETMSVLGLDLSYNQLTGPVPPLPKNATSIDISMNSLSGSLPASFGVNLLELVLFSNRITGRIPESICKSEELTNIDLADNLLEGELPKCFGHRALVYLDLSNNSLSGQIPSFMQNCLELHVLDLSRNTFSGRIPEWIGKLMGLQFLRLSQNIFSGDIPVNITNLECLQYIDISDNSMSGSLPGDLSNLAALRHKYPAGFCSKDTITDDSLFSLSTFLKGQKLNYGSISRIISLNMKNIDLSLNNFSGEIPEELVTFEGLVTLNLSRNHFSGHVPTNIGAMESLESLDLSRNEFSGEIPASLTNLTFLSYLDLSYNNLEGRIPSGSQLDTLYAANPSMYTGNIGLCGPPLKKICSSTDASKQGHSIRAEEGPALEVFYIGLGCGFITGTWAAFFALLFIRQWRIAFFRLLDKLY
ncbi:hypothetical protein BS78_05G181000, partial [Paspalum vaginatum]